MNNSEVTKNPRITKKQKFLLEHGFDPVLNDKHFKFEHKDGLMTIIINNLSQDRFLELANEFFVKKKTKVTLKLPEPKSVPMGTKRVRKVRVKKEKKEEEPNEDVDVNYEPDHDDSIL